MPVASRSVQSYLCLYICWIQSSELLSIPVGWCYIRLFVCLFVCLFVFWFVFCLICICWMPSLELLSIPVGWRYIRPHLFVCILICILFDLYLLNTQLGAAQYSCWLALYPSTLVAPMLPPKLPQNTCCLAGFDFPLNFQTNHVWFSGFFEDLTRPRAHLVAPS